MMLTRKMPYVLVLIVLVSTLLVACGANSGLYVPNLIANAQEYNGKDITVDGAYIGRPGEPALTVLALGITTLDNGLDAQPIGDQIWLENFPQEAAQALHQPGDAVYGWVRVNGRFEADGNYGPNNAYQYRIQVTSASPIQRIVRTETRVSNASLGEGKIALPTLFDNAGAYNGQTITTQGYYFWNGPLAVLAEGISTEEGGGSPQPIGRMMWIDGFPPELSAQLNLGPNNSYVWGKIEVTGVLQSGGSFGKDGAYTEHIQVTAANAVN